MKNFKNYSATAAGLVIMTVLLVVTISEARSKVDTDTLKLLATVAYNHAQQASQEASLAAKRQQRLVKSLIGKAIGGAATDDNKEPQQAGGLTSREVAREKAVLQQLEANARRSAEVLESVKRLAAEVDRKEAGLDGIRHLIATTQMKAQSASDEALHGAESQRKLVKQQEMLRVGDGRQQTARLSAREMAREKAMLQQLEANAKRSAEVLESVKRLAAEVDRKAPR